MLETLELVLQKNLLVKKLSPKNPQKKSLTMQHAQIREGKTSNLRHQ